MSVSDSAVDRVWVDRDVVFTGIWKLRRPPDDAFMRRASEQCEEEGGAESAWRLTGEGLSLVVKRSASGQQGQTDPIPAVALRAVGTSRHNPRCLLTAYTRPNAGLHVLVCRCQSDQDAADMVAAFRQLRAALGAQGGDDKSGGRAGAEVNGLSRSSSVSSSSLSPPYSRLGPAPFLGRHGGSSRRCVHSSGSTVVRPIEDVYHVHGPPRPRRTHLVLMAVTSKTPADVVQVPADGPQAPSPPASPPAPPPASPPFTDPAPPPAPPPTTPPLSDPAPPAAVCAADDADVVPPATSGGTIATE